MVITCYDEPQPAATLGDVHVTAGAERTKVDRPSNEIHCVYGLYAF
jgi:hypothetical protein